MPRPRASLRRLLFAALPLLLFATPARAEEVFLRIAEPDPPPAPERKPALEKTLVLAPGGKKSLSFTWKGRSYRAEVSGERRPPAQQARPGTIDWFVRVYRTGTKQPVSSYEIQTYADYTDNCGTSPNVVFDGLWIVLGAGPKGSMPAACAGIVDVVRKGRF